MQSNGEDLYIFSRFAILFFIQKFEERMNEIKIFFKLFLCVHELIIIYGASFFAYSDFIIADFKKNL